MRSNTPDCSCGKREINPLSARRLLHARIRPRLMNCSARFPAGIRRARRLDAPALCRDVTLLPRGMFRHVWASVGPHTCECPGLVPGIVTLLLHGSVPHVFHGHPSDQTLGMPRPCAGDRYAPATREVLRTFSTGIRRARRLDARPCAGDRYAPRYTGSVPHVFHGHPSGQTLGMPRPCAGDRYAPRYT